MEIFEGIVGHSVIKEYFNNILLAERLSHSYIFEGTKGVGKKSLAKQMAKFILCEAKNESGPCNTCKSCHMIDSGNHPDFTLVGKDTKVTKIETIREKVVKEMSIKPYQSEYKVIVIEDAGNITIEGQNAMLKTIEEPPAYGIIILDTVNSDQLLPTIKSRCIHIRFSPLNEEEIADYLKAYYEELTNLNVYIKFASGSIGVAKKLVEDESFLNLRQKAIQYLLTLEKANLIDVYKLVKEICDNKEEIMVILEFWEIWYRDLAMLKTHNATNLYYLDYRVQLLDMLSNITYNKISIDLDHIRVARSELARNIYPTFVIENLLLKLKKRK